MQKLNCLNEKDAATFEELSDYNCQIDMPKSKFLLLWHLLYSTNLGKSTWERQKIYINNQTTVKRMLKRKEVIFVFTINPDKNNFGIYEINFKKGGGEAAKGRKKERNMYRVRSNITGSGFGFLWDMRYPRETGK